jgi:hypothetical protein
MQPRLSSLSSHSLMVSCQGVESVHFLPTSLRQFLSVAKPVMEKEYGGRGGSGKGNCLF